MNEQISIRFISFIIKNESSYAVISLQKPEKLKWYRKYTFFFFNLFSSTESLKNNSFRQNFTCICLSVKTFYIIVVSLLLIFQFFLKTVGYIFFIENQGLSLNLWCAVKRCHNPVIKHKFWTPKPNLTLFICYWNRNLVIFVYDIQRWDY